MSMDLVPTLGPERRYIGLVDVEQRGTDSPRLRFAGTAAVFGKRAYIGARPYGFWEEVRTGAFAKAIAEGDVAMLHNHDPNLILARSTIHEGPGRLTMHESDMGLRTDAEFIDTSYARDLDEVIRRRGVSQMSFSFRPVKETMSRVEDTGEDLRSLVEVALFDVSTVVFPAYTETDAAMRAIGLDGLLRHADLTEEDRIRFFSAIRSGVITPDLAPMLRAASQALVDLAQKCEPAPPTRAQEVDLSTEQIRLRYRALAAMSASWQKGVTT